MYMLIGQWCLTTSGAKVVVYMVDGYLETVVTTRTVYLIIPVWMAPNTTTTRWE